MTFFGVLVFALVVAAMAVGLFFKKKYSNGGSGGGKGGGSRKSRK